MLSRSPPFLGGILGTELPQRPDGGNLSCWNFRLVEGDGRVIVVGSAWRDVRARVWPSNPAPKVGLYSSASAPRGEGWLASHLALLVVVPALLHLLIDL